MRTRLSLSTHALGIGLSLTLAACNGSSPDGQAPMIAVGGAFVGAQGGSVSGLNGGAPSQSGGNAANRGGSSNGGMQTGNGGVAAQNGGSNSGNGGSNNGNGGSNSGNGGSNNGNGGNGSASSGGSGTGTCTDTPRPNETCANAKLWGFCGQDWFGDYCRATCGKCTATGSGGSNSAGGKSGAGGAAAGGAAAGGRTGSGGAASGGAVTGSGGSTSGGQTVPRLTNGKPAKTTRYWDCCKPSCGWTANVGGKTPAKACGKDGVSAQGVDAKSSCDNGGPAYQCNWGVPWEVSSTLSYGYVAFNGNNCGKCYQIDFTGTGDNAGAQSLGTAKKTMIVQSINIGDLASEHFDILIPGGGVGANNACYGAESWKQWGNVNGGAQSGGFLATCGNTMSCITDMCTKAFGSNATLMAGCNWFVGWFAGANNPGVNYAEVACPAALTDKSGLK